MLDETTPAESGTPVDAAAEEAARKAAARKAAAKKAAETRKRKAAEAAAAAAAGETAPAGEAEKAPAAKAPAKKAAAKKTAAKKAAAPAPESAAVDTAAAEAEVSTAKAPAKKTAARKAPARKTAAAPQAETTDEAAGGAATAVLFQAPEATTAPRRRPAKKAAAKPADAKPADAETADATETTDVAVEGAEAGEQKQAPKQQNRQRQQPKKTAAAAPAADGEQPTETETDAEGAGEDESGEEGTGGPRRRRRRGGRRRRKPSEGGEGGESTDDSGEAADADDDQAEDGEDGEGGTTRRRRVRVREGQSADTAADANTQVRVRPAKSAEDQITSISGSTRLEAKKQRRREGREAGRRRAPIASEAEFLARREAVERVMVIRQRKDLTQIGVLEDKVLVEHYVARESQTSLIGNVYLGRVQNVLPSMEAAFIDIGKGRNAVLYAGEVNWSALGHKDGQPRKIESVLSSGQTVLVQVTKDPVGHKGARLTSQVSLAGRFLVYVPDGTTSGISRKLPDTERARLKTLLKEIVPDTAGVIVRTAAEGASEEELTRDVERLKARWEEIEKQTKGDAKGNAPKLLYGEPDLTLKVVRDLFTEDFSKLVIQGDDAWDTVQQYVAHVAPDLEERLEKFEQRENGGDIFSTYRIDEQIAKGLDRKVWLPSGGSLIIDRTEAMTVVDVNTGKFTGSGGNLEETVTKNNLEAAEEIVRQLRLRDIGGIIVVDFIDMVLESNRDLVLRRMVECLGRDRTRHQVAEVTSLGLVQMTRKRIGTGLVEAFSENCEHCQGRGVVIHNEPIEPKGGVSGAEEPRRNRRNRGGRGGEGGQNGGQNKQDNQKQDGQKQDGQKQDGQKQDGGKAATPPTPKDVAAKARHEADEAAESAMTEAVEAPAAEAPAEVPQEQAVVAAAEAPVEDVAEAVVVAEAEVPLAAAAIEEPEAAPAVQEPVAPAAPKVVTRTRRVASRPAGATAAQAEPVAIVVPEVAVSDHTPVVEPPKVITRTRKAVTRPAGVGAATPAVQPAADVPVEAPEEASATEETPAEATPELHVPIKKKGARKR